MKILLLSARGRVDLVGGVENVLCNFANEFVRRGFDVGIVFNDVAAGIKPSYPLDSRVRLFNLNGTNRLAFSLVLAKVYREIVKPLRRTFLAPFVPNLYKKRRDRLAKPKLDQLFKTFCPDAVVAFSLDDAKTLFFGRKNVDFATIQTEHNDPRREVPRPTSEDRATLARCDVVQVLTQSFVPLERRFCSAPIVVVPNVVPQFSERVDFDEREQTGAPRVVCIGRLDRKVKRQHLLIEAFSKIAADCPNWTLWFFGDEKKDRYRRPLTRLVAQKGLQNRVFLCRSTQRVRDELLNSDVFAFPSASEGFGLALAEAQSLGLPSVGFRATPGVNELIVDGQNGFLADDLDDFAAKLKTLIKSKELRAKFGAAAKKSVERFDATIVWNRWEELICETIAAKKARNETVDSARLD